MYYVITTTDDGKNEDIVQGAYTHIEDAIELEHELLSTALFDSVIIARLLSDKEVQYEK